MNQVSGNKKKMRKKLRNSNLAEECNALFGYDPWKFTKNILTDNINQYSSLDECINCFIIITEYLVHNCIEYQNAQFRIFQDPYCLSLSYINVSLSVSILRSHISKTKPDF